ncbi:hypothetical protein [Anaeromyxobacter oryzae]|uniref:Uncharacterized protein n=1 Tax=Anaeromyxobacter oryzae TaxID=2918170 RepID=A0ABM7WQZ1_9BACT|nr:hypothetical protein [Anaeromyxobacter oryzae]BDG01895.1 hypothetical protein AMOR_08910 [Anaeromyxobacter oryzae]
MAATLHYFMLPEDERAVFRHLARRELTLYPELVPPGWTPLPVHEDTIPKLEGSSWYIAAERFGPVIVHPVKKGPDKGLLVIEEIPSPVFHYERSIRNEEGELVAGRLWAELEVTDDPMDRKGKPLALKSIFEEVHHLFRKNWRRSDPKGFWVGPAAGAAWKRGDLVLREAGHKGREIGVWR